MFPRHLMLPLVFLCLLPRLASAGPVMDWLTGKSKVDPAQRVPALIATLNSDKADRSRTSAAEELSAYDPKQFTDIYPTLIRALQNDPTPSVRIAAATSIGKLRPASQEAGYALEQASTGDSSIRVKAAAEAALLKYKLLGGYTSGKGGDAKSDQSEEPPLAPPYDRPTKVKAMKTSGPVPVDPNQTKTPVSSDPMKNPPKKEGFFNLPTWLGGREKEKEVPSPLPVQPLQAKPPAVKESEPPPLLIPPPATPGPSLGSPK